MTKILGDGTRQRTRAFSELQSHYLFEDRFGRPGQGNDKGHVEGTIGFGRRNFLVPMPRFENFEAHQPVARRDLPAPATRRVSCGPSSDEPPWPSRRGTGSGRLTPPDASLPDRRVA